MPLFPPPPCALLAVRLVPCPLPVLLNGRGVGKKGIGQGCSHHRSVQGEVSGPFQVVAPSAVCQSSIVSNKMEEHARKGEGDDVHSNTQTSRKCNVTENTR